MSVCEPLVTTTTSLSNPSIASNLHLSSLNPSRDPSIPLSLSPLSESMLANLLLSSRSTRHDYEPEPPICPQRKTSVMATLLSYGFTASSKPAKKTTGQPKRSQSQQASLPVLKSPLFVRSPESPLPPIPKTEPLSIPHLEAGAKRRSRTTPSGTYVKSSVLRRADSKLGRPPRSVAISPDDSYIEQPPVFSAAVFPPTKSCDSSMPRNPTKGLQESSGRIQKILKTKQMGGIHIDQGYLDVASAVRRGSIALTPVSAYGPRSSSLKAHSDMVPYEQEMALTPIEMDLGALEVIASTPDRGHHSRKKSLVKATWRDSVCGPSSRNSVVAVELPGGSVMAVITPEQSAWQRAPYVPGPIRLEPKSKAERSPLAIIQETVSAELGLDKERSAAEQVIVDELVDFIESFGEEFTVEETGIDAFWIDSPSTLLPLRLSNAHLSPWSTATTLVHSPPATSVPRFSTCDYPDDWKDQFGDLNEPDFKTRDLPSGGMKRASFASSQYSDSSRTMSSPHNSFSTYSPPPVKQHPYGPPSPLHSPSTSNLQLSGSHAAVPRKVRQVKGKGTTSNGQKMSFRGLIRSAASIV